MCRESMPPLWDEHDAYARRSSRYTDSEPVLDRLGDSHSSASRGAAPLKVEVAIREYRRRSANSSVPKMLGTHAGTVYKTASPRFYPDVVDGLPEGVRQHMETRFHRADFGQRTRLMEIGTLGT